MGNTELIFGAAGLVFGLVAGLLFAAWQRSPLAGRLAALISANEMLTQENQRLHSQQTVMQEEVIQLNRSLAETESENGHLKAILDSKAEELEGLQRQFSMQFENLAGRLFEENTEKLSRQNQSQLNQIVEPLKEKIKEFEERVRITHRETSEQNAILKEQINTVREMGMRMSDETQSLTRALKGDMKKQGSWGELILERILESSGLEKGREFILQANLEDEIGARQIPDAVVVLPENKHIIIDAKVSLVAFEEWGRAEEESQRQKCLSRHLTSIRNHISGLSERHYISAKGLHSPDFVLMFIPIEACLSISLQSDNQLFEYAWKRKIVLVTPTTLLATLKTVSSLWKYEKQNTNAMKIADMGRKIYEQIVEFLEDMERLDKGLDSARTAYTEAMNRLKTSSHSILRRSEKLKEFGVSPKKQIPASYLEQPEDIIPLQFSEEPATEAATQNNE